MDTFLAENPDQRSKRGFNGDETLELGSEEVQQKKPSTRERKRERGWEWRREKGNNRSERREKKRQNRERERDEIWEEGGRNFDWWSNYLCYYELITTQKSPKNIIYKETKYSKIRKRQYDTDTVSASYASTRIMHSFFKTEIISQITQRHVFNSLKYIYIFNLLSLIQSSNLP